MAHSVYAARSSRCSIVWITVVLLTDAAIDVKPRPHQQQCQSNIVECYKSNDSFDKSNVDSTLLPSRATMSNEISSFRQSRNTNWTRSICFDFVERIVRLVAIDNIASTLVGCVFFIRSHLQFRGTLWAWCHTQKLLLTLSLRQCYRCGRGLRHVRRWSESGARRASHVERKWQSSPSN